MDRHRFFRNLVIAVAGDFGQARTYANIQNHIEAAGGVFAGERYIRATHIVASEEFAPRLIAQAQTSRLYRRQKIVTFDWLENSLLERCPLPEEEYLWERQNHVAETARRKREARRVAVAQRIRRTLADFDRACLEFKADISFFRADHHPYFDTTGFVYDINLVRVDLISNQNECFNLRLFQHNLTPYFFVAYVKYSGPTPYAAPFIPAIQVLAPEASYFWDAFAAWKDFFKAKTMRSWDDRIEKREKIGAGSPFVYFLPPEREPRGLIVER